jgi:hypothetical protein
MPLLTELPRSWWNCPTINIALLSERYPSDDNPQRLMYKGAAIPNPARGAYVRLTHI